MTVKIIIIKTLIGSLILSGVLGFLWYIPQAPEVVQKGAVLIAGIILFILASFFIGCLVTLPSDIADDSDEYCPPSY